MCFRGLTGPTSRKKKVQQAHPVLKKNGTKNGISRLKTGYREYGQTNALPFLSRSRFTPSRFRSVSVYPKKTKTNGKKTV
jgi:hypothetical protein